MAARIESPRVCLLLDGDFYLRSALEISSDARGENCWRHDSWSRPQVYFASSHCLLPSLPFSQVSGGLWNRRGARGIATDLGRGFSEIYFSTLEQFSSQKFVAGSAKRDSKQKSTFCEKFLVLAWLCRSMIWWRIPQKIAKRFSFVSACSRNPNFQNRTKASWIKVITLPASNSVWNSYKISEFSLQRLFYENFEECFRMKLPARTHYCFLPRRVHLTALSPEWVQKTLSFEEFSFMHF